jgi:hypothetical protein
MSRFVSDIIGDFRSKVLVNDYIIFRNLNPLLQERELAETYPTIFTINEALLQLDNRILIGNFSCFFRLHAKKLLSVLTTEDPSQPELEAAINAYVLSAVDCFLHALPENLVLHFPGASLDEILILPVVQQKVQLRRIEGKKISHLLKYLQQQQTPRFVFPIIGTDDPSVFTAKHPTLFEDDYINELAENECEVGTYLADLKNALLLIEKASPDKFFHIISTIQFIVPVKYTDQDTHRSFSSSLLPDVLFMSENAGSLELAEAVIHESGHNYLNQVMSTTDLLTGKEGTKLFYSPWRKDPRPLTGLFHAIFVFTEVCTFYRLLLKKDVLSKHDVAKARFNMHKNFYRIMVALPQLKRQYFTAEGWTVVTAIKKNLLAISRSLSNEFGHLKTKEENDSSSRRML